MKVLTVLGTRPELIKLCEVIKALDKSTEHVLVHTGQNFDYELNEIFFDDLELRRPDYFLNVAGSSSIETIANTLIRTDEVFRKEKPDAILIYGDTNSGLSVISAKKLKIPVFHMEAGNRSYDERVPEEVNRRLIDHLSDVNMVITEHARRNLLSEGRDSNLTFKIGSSMPELLNKYSPNIERSEVLSELNLLSKDYILVSAHREENVDSRPRLMALCRALQLASEKFSKRIIFSVHPRTRKRLLDYDIDTTGLELMPPLGFFSYVNLQEKAFCVLSDSGTITEESSILGFPAVTIRQSHERPEGFDAGVLLMSDFVDIENLIACINVAVEQSIGNSKFIARDYGDEAVSNKVVKIVLSYVGYINRHVWKKY